MRISKARNLLLKILKRRFEKLSLQTQFSRFTQVQHSRTKVSSSCSTPLSTIFQARLILLQLQVLIPIMISQKSAQQMTRRHLQPLPSSLWPTHSSDSSFSSVSTLEHLKLVHIFTTHE